MGRVETVKNRFGSAVRRERMRRGLSQEQLAGICGLDRSYIGGVERGERNPSLMIVERIALGLGMSLAELFKGVSSGSSKSAGTKER